MNSTNSLFTQRHQDIKNVQVIISHVHCNWKSTLDFLVLHHLPCSHGQIHPTMCLPSPITHVMKQCNGLPGLWYVYNVYNERFATRIEFWSWFSTARNEAKLRYKEDRLRRMWDFSFFFYKTWQNRVLT